MHKVLKGTDIENKPHILFIGGMDKAYTRCIRQWVHCFPHIGSYARHIYFDGFILEKCFYKKK